MSQGHTFKVVLLGEGCVGKTSCVVRYVQDQFNDRHMTTLQASFLNKKINLRGKRANLSIWDTAGQERFHALGPIYYRDADGAILVYDITDVDSFNKVKVWVKELRKMLGADSISMAIVGNKTDLEKQRNVDAKAAQEYALSVGAHHFHTSAKLNKGIEELFIELTQSMISKAEQRGQHHTEISSQDLAAAFNTRGTITIVDDTQTNGNSNKKCCG